MDVSALNEVAIRHKAIENVGKIKEKLSEEKSRIVKLRVKQDATYWELEEKYAELNGKYTRLQHNLNKQQMDFETLSSKYQEEVRRRPEAINNLMSNSKVNDLLEGNLNRIRESLQRTARDCKRLTESYERASQRVTAAQADTDHQLRAANHATREAQDSAKVNEERCGQLSNIVKVLSQRADKTCDELQRVRDERDRSLAENKANYESLLATKEKSIQDLRDQLKRVSTEYKDQMENLRKKSAELEREAGAASALRETLVQANSRYDMLVTDAEKLNAELLEAITTNTQKENQNKELQSALNSTKKEMVLMVNKADQIVIELKDKNQKLQSLEETVIKLNKELETATDRISHMNEVLQRERREFAEQIDILKNELLCQRKEHELQLSTCVELQEKEKHDFQEIIINCEQKLNECNETIKSLKLDIETKTHTTDELNNEIKRVRLEKDEHVSDLERSLSEKVQIIDNLKGELAANKEMIADANNTIEEQKSELERKLNDLEEQKNAFQVKLAKSEEANARIQKDLMEAADKATLAEEALNSSKAELNTARADAAHNMDIVRRLEAAIRIKDEEANKQMKIVLTTRAENEKLQDKIQEMQNTINDIQKITHRRPAAVSAAPEPPEHDHNAMDVPASPLQRRPLSPAPARPPLQAARAPPAAPAAPAAPAPVDPKHNTYNLFSDTDNEDSQLDIYRRFDAMSRGIPLTPIKLSTNKRPRKHKMKPAEPFFGSAMSPPRVPTDSPKRKFFKTRRTKRE